MSDARIPVTVLTGWLGAGKTTLLNRILSQDHGRRYAVIVNEFGEIGIDHELIVRADEELFEMNNGCVCCTVRGDLIRTLHGLLGRAAVAQRAFDAIVVETTGLADPGPVAQTFFVDPFLLTRTRLDSITTVVDAAHVLHRLRESREAAEQIALADQIVVNKTDLVSAEQLRDVVSALRRTAVFTSASSQGSDEPLAVPVERVLVGGELTREATAALHSFVADYNVAAARVRADAIRAGRVAAPVEQQGPSQGLTDFHLCVGACRATQTHKTSSGIHLFGE